jgi:phosphonate transport system substrate-binding protein
MRENMRPASGATKITALFVFFLAALLPRPCFPEAVQEEITIGLVPEMNVFAQVQRFQPLADHLSQLTGITIKLSILNRYSSVVEELRQQRIDAAFLGSFTAALAIEQLGVTPVARPVNLDNTSTYHGIILARKDSNIKNVANMRGKTIAFVERSTTAGYVFPLAWLKERGIEHYQEFFGGYFFAGSHDAAIDAVMNKKADVGAAKNTIYEYYLAKSPGAATELTIIARSKPVPSNGLCVSRTVNKATIAKLQSALISLDKTARGRNVLKKMRALKFVETRADDYAPVFNLIKEAGMPMELFLKKNFQEQHQ